MNAGVNPVNPEMTSNKQSTGSGGVNDFKSDFALGTAENANRAQVFQDPSMLYNFREMQRRLVEFIKKKSTSFGERTQCRVPESLFCKLSFC